MKFIKKFRREVNVALSKLCRRKTTVDYMGMRLRVPLIYGMGRGYLIAAEFWMSRYIEVLTGLKQGAVLDIGGNVGVFLVKLRVLDKEREYYGFEPHPACNFYVQEMIRLNNFKQTHFYPVALSNKNETRTLYAGRLGDKRASMHRFMRENEELGFSFEMVAVHGDEFLQRLDIDEVSLIKIDVEGAELEVLEGISEFIRKYQPLIYCEVWGLEDEVGEYNERKWRLDAILGRLKEIDYQVIGITEQGDTGLVNAIEDFDANYRPEYVFAPASMTAQVIEGFKRLS